MAIPPPNIAPERLEHVRGLFGQDQNGIPLVRNHLESAAAELARLSSIPSKLAERQAALARFGGYTTFRLNEVIGRRGYLEWLREVLAEPGRNDLGHWSVFGSMALKDFHADVASLMDSVAAVAISIDHQVKKEDLEKLPGFPDISPGSSRTYRTNLSEDVRLLVDATGAWWPFIKGIRDLVVHRRHNRIIFGGAKDGYLFQIYLPKDIAVVVDPAITASVGTGIADFSLYSSWVLAEVLYLFDTLGKLVFGRFGFAPDLLQGGGRVGGMRPLIRDIDVLLGRLKP